MYGERIKITVEALTLLMKSLPNGSKFALISYGSNMYYMPDKEELISYTNQSCKEALEAISTIDADMGGNEEKKPLTSAVNLMKRSSDGEMKNIFLITDGGVGYPD
jgi:hypothetical protein